MTTNTATIRYFRSKFHIFDAIVIITAFVIDVLLRGPVEEAGSLVVVLRLWRVFKIIEEFSTGAEDSMAALQERIAGLEREKEDILTANQALRTSAGRRNRDMGMHPGNHLDEHAE